MNLTDTFDLYLNQGLRPEEKEAFEKRLLQDKAFNQAFENHKELIEAMHFAEQRSSFKKRLTEIHKQVYGENSRVISINRESSFATRHGRTIVVAASTALIAVLATVAALSTGGYLLKKQNNEILELKRNVMELRYSNEGIVEGITKKKNRAVYSPANLEGSAFALNNKGYVVTSYHMVKSADSIFIQNNETERSHAKLVYPDESIDLAI